MQPKAKDPADYSSPLPGAFPPPEEPKPVRPVPPHRRGADSFRRFWLSWYMIPWRLALAVPLFLLRGLWRELRGSRLPALRTELERLRLEITSQRAQQAKARAQDRQSAAELAEQISREVQARLDSMHHEIRHQLERDWQLQIRTEVERQLRRATEPAAGKKKAPPDAKAPRPATPGTGKHVADDLVKHLLHRK